MPTLRRAYLLIQKTGKKEKKKKKDVYWRDNTVELISHSGPSLIRYIIGLRQCSRGFIHEINYTTDESHLHVVQRNKSEPTSGHSHVFEDTSYLIMQSKRTCMLLRSIIATHETHTSSPPHQQFNTTVHTTQKETTSRTDQYPVSLSSKTYVFGDKMTKH